MSRRFSAVVTMVVAAVIVAAGCSLSAAAAGEPDITIIGGASWSGIVCANVAIAENLARQHGIPNQRTRCAARAVGGSTLLTNVDIYLSHATQPIGAGGAALAALADGTTSGVAEANCADRRPPPPRGLQLNKCWAIAHGGRLNLRNVTVVNHNTDGASSSRVVTDLTVPGGDAGDANAWCANVVSDPLDQRDDCAADGTGASWGLRGVDVVVHNPDGSTSTRHGIDVQVRGGDAHTEIYCSTSPMGTDTSSRSTSATRTHAAATRRFAT